MKTKKIRRRAENPRMVLTQKPPLKNPNRKKRYHLPAPTRGPVWLKGDVVVLKFFNVVDPTFGTIVRVKRSKQEYHNPKLEWDYTIRYDGGGLTGTCDPTQMRKPSMLELLARAATLEGFDDKLPVRVGDRVVIYDRCTLGGCRGVVVEKTRHLWHGDGRIFGVRIEEPGPWGRHREHVGYVYHLQRRFVRRLTTMEKLAEAPFRDYDGTIKSMHDKRDKVASLFLSPVNPRHTGRR